MNPITFFEEQIQKWNEEEKCGLCFAFSAPLKESAINIQQLRENEKCCVQVMLTDLRFNQQKTYGANGLITDDVCLYSFNLFVLKPSVLGINNYNEIDGHKVSESKWKKNIEPLLDCFGCDAILDFCEIWNYPIQVTRWGDAEVLINYQDLNYDGWKIPITFRIRK